MAPFDTVLITNTVSRVPLPFIKNRSTPASVSPLKILSTTLLRPQARTLSAPRQPNVE